MSWQDSTISFQMKTRKVLLLLSFAFVLSHVLGKAEEVTDYEWKYFVFSQWWPQSQCYYKHDADSIDNQIFRIVNEYRFKNDCVPADVNDWTIHGLWPTLNGTPYPVNCNHSWPFHIDDIGDLKAKMMVQWIALPDVSKSEALWKHEWEKHGTCASSLPGLSNQHAYFFKTLSLNLQFDLLKMLKERHIFPSDDDTYKVRDIEDAIMDGYGAKGRVICLRGPDGDQYLGGLRICLDKKFQPIDCIETEPEKCSEDESLKYPVIIRS